MSEQCKQQIMDHWQLRNCQRKVVKDGYCKQHHPDAVEQRTKDSKARYDAKTRKMLAPSRKIKQLEKVNTVLLEVLERIIGNPCTDCYAYDIALKATCDAKVVVKARSEL